MSKQRSKFCYTHNNQKFRATCYCFLIMLYKKGAWRRFVQILVILQQRTVKAEKGTFLKKITVILA